MFSDKNVITHTPTYFGFTVQLSLWMETADEKFSPRQTLIHIEDVSNSSKVLKIKPYHIFIVWEENHENNGTLATLKLISSGQFL